MPVFSNNKMRKQPTNPTMAYAPNQPLYTGSVPQPQATSPTSSNTTLINMQNGPVYEQEPFKMESAKRAGKDWLPYKGKPEMIIAIDLGTTYSGASYCILTPGKKPQIDDVKSYPGQATSGSKVPSIVLYDSTGQPRLFGAQAIESSAAAAKLLDEDGAQAKWWKLHLKPPHLQLLIDPEDEDVPLLDPLPFGIPAETIVAQFLSYMVMCVGLYIKSRHSNGLEILTQLAEQTRYVITVPNGWELPQQEVLRSACIEAGIVAPERAHTIAFVSEAEASVNFCAHSPSSGNWIQRPGQELIVCDAGGGTIDISTYRVERVEPSLILTETSQSDCLMAGSTTVDRRAKQLMQDRLRDTDWNNPIDLEDLQVRFCSTIKETFSDGREDQYLPIGNAGLNKPELGISKGKLIFKGEEIASLYEPSIRAAEASIRNRCVPGHCPTVAMVGGFSESVYFRSELQRRLGNNVNLCKPDEATSKAVASGAVAWLIDGVVSSRVAKMHYGIRCSVLFRNERPSHQARISTTFEGADGKTRLTGSFGSVLKKGETEREDEEHIESFGLTWEADRPVTKAVSLFVYRGEEENPPEFIDEGGFEELCKFQIDLEVFRPMLAVKQTQTGKKFISASVQLAMKLSGTTISAQVIFKNGDQLFRGPVSTLTDTGASDD